MMRHRPEARIPLSGISVHALGDQTPISVLREVSTTTDASKILDMNPLLSSARALQEIEQSLQVGFRKSACVGSSHMTARVASRFFYAHSTESSIISKIIYDVEKQ